MDENEVEPSLLFSQLGMLVVESRMPEYSVKGRSEGPHCPKDVGDGVRHVCSRKDERCTVAEYANHQMAVLWKNRIPVCVEVLLYPECRHGQEKAQNVDILLPGVTNNCVLLEQWTIQAFSYRGGDSLVSARVLFQAVKSYLHFSQLSAWLNLSHGQAPKHIAYRISPPGEFCTTSFEEEPEVHTFPITSAKGRIVLKVSVKALQRREEAIIVPCHLQCEEQPLQCGDVTGPEQPRQRGTVGEACRRSPVMVDTCRRSPVEGCIRSPIETYRKSPVLEPHRQSPVEGAKRCSPVSNYSRKGSERHSPDSPQGYDPFGGARYQSVSPSSGGRHHSRSPSSGARYQSPVPGPTMTSSSSRQHTTSPPPSLPSSVCSGHKTLDQCYGAIPKTPPPWKDTGYTSHPEEFDHHAMSAPQLENYVAGYATRKSPPTDPHSKSVDNQKVLLSRNLPGPLSYAKDSKGWPLRPGTKDYSSTDSEQSSPEIDKCLRVLQNTFDPVSPQDMQCFLANLNPNVRRSRKESPNSPLGQNTLLDVISSCSSKNSCTNGASPLKVDPFISATSDVSSLLGAMAIGEAINTITTTSASGTKNLKSICDASNNGAGDEKQQESNGVACIEAAVTDNAQNGSPRRNKSCLTEQLQKVDQVKFVVGYSEELEEGEEKMKGSVELLRNKEGASTNGASNGHEAGPGGEPEGATNKATSLLRTIFKKDLTQKLDDDANHNKGCRIPTPQERATFRRSLDNSANVIFHAATGLPLQSSPAPLKRKTSSNFDYDGSLMNTRAIKNSLSCANLEDKNKNGTSPEKSSQRPYSTSAPAFTNCLLGNFEESVLNGRIEPMGVVEGFTADIGASGSFCPKHIKLPVTAFFFSLSDDNAPSPYLGHIDLESLGKRGYHIPKQGTIQVTLFNPNQHVVKMFVVMYDMSDMPPNCQTFLRHRTLYMPTRPAAEEEELPSYLRYLIHLRFASSKSGRIYLHTDIRLIFARDRVEYDSRIKNYELRSFTEGPINPHFSPKR